MLLHLITAHRALMWNMTEEDQEETTVGLTDPQVAYCLWCLCRTAAVCLLTNWPNLSGIKHYIADLLLRSQVKQCVQVRLKVLKIHWTSPNLNFRNTFHYPGNYVSRQIWRELGDSEFRLDDFLFYTKKTNWKKHLHFTEANISCIIPLNYTKVQPKS